jgi:hypothetical protein
MVDKRKLRKGLPEAPAGKVERGTNLRAQRIQKAKPKPVEKAKKEDRPPGRYRIDNATLSFHVGDGPEQQMPIPIGVATHADRLERQLQESMRLPRELILEPRRSTTNSTIQAFASDLANSARRATVLMELTERIGYLARRVESITLSYEAESVDMNMMGQRVARPRRGNAYSVEVHATAEGSDRTAIPDVATAVVAQSLLTHVGIMADAIAGLHTQVAIREVDLMIFGEAYFFVAASYPGAENNLLIVFDACGVQVRSSAYSARGRLTKRMMMMETIMLLGGLM